MREFPRKYNLDRHLENRGEKCLSVETRIKKKMDKEIQAVKEKHETVVNELVNSTSVIKERKKILKNIESRDKIVNMRTIIPEADIPIEELRASLHNVHGGDIILFKKYFVENIEPNDRCIRVRDFARNKYEYFDGQDWVVVPLNYIAELILKDLEVRYRVVIHEKLEKLKQVDQTWNRFREETKFRNYKEYDAVTQQYENETTHFSLLSSRDKTFRKEFAQEIKKALHNSKN